MIFEARQGVGICSGGVLKMIPQFLKFMCSFVVRIWAICANQRWGTCKRAPPLMSKPTLSRLPRIPEGVFRLCSMCRRVAADGRYFFSPARVPSIATTVSLHKHMTAEMCGSA